MNRAKRILAGALTALTLLFCAVPTTSIHAESTAKKTYTVTFRAGNVGSFNLNANNTSGENIEATPNYIKFTVEKGECLSSTFDFISDDASLNAYLLNITSASNETDATDYIDSGYRLRDVADWCEGAANTPINRNTEYVLDYAKLVDSVRYVIRFVDAESLEQIAPPTIAYGNAGETIVCNPLTIAGYRTEDVAVQLVLSAEDETANVVTFAYTYTGENNAVVETITEYEQGDVVVETVMNQVEVPTPAGPVNVIADGENAGEGNVEEADAENAGNITIEDEQVPLAAEEENRVTIEDEQVPLAAENEKGMPFGWGAILGTTVAAVSVVIAGTIIMKRRKKVAIVEKSKEKIEQK